jgi:hypothetical protein
MSKLALRAALVAAAGILISIGGCAEAPSAPATADLASATKVRAPASPSYSREGRASKVIGPEGGVLVTAEGHQLVFPAGALREPTEITMTTDPEYVGVELEPHGLVFPAGRGPMLTLNYSGADVSPFRSLAVVYVDDAGTPLELLPTTNLGGAEKVRTRLQHFSGYITIGT